MTVSYGYSLTYLHSPVRGVTYQLALYGRFRAYHRRSDPMILGSTSKVKEGTTRTNVAPRIPHDIRGINSGI